MVVIECSVPNCTFTTDDVSEALAIALLSNHNLAHRNLAPTVADAAPAPTAPRGPKLERPKVDVGVTIEEWNVFMRRWEFSNQVQASTTPRRPPSYSSVQELNLGTALSKPILTPLLGP